MTLAEWIVFLVFFLVFYAAIVAIYGCYLAADTSRISVVTFTLCCGLCFLWGMRSANNLAPLGHDFPAFYVAGNLPLKSLYSRQDFISFRTSRLASLGITYYIPYVRPAIFAIPLKPMAWLSYWHAYWLWAAACIASYFAALFLLFRWIKLPIRLLPAFGLFTPSLYGVILGQDSTAYLLVIVTAIWLLASGKDGASGWVLAACDYKFNLIILIPVVLIANKRWKTLTAFAAGSSLAAMASAVLTSPSEYLIVLRSVHVFDGLHAFLILIRHQNWFVPLAATGVIGCAYLITQVPLREGFCVAIIGALLFGYHSVWYDRALLVLPICVLWNQVGRATRTLLLAALVFPPAWEVGGSVMQVATETMLLASFALIAWKPRQPETE